jgi:hypothetical protein
MYQEKSIDWRETILPEYHVAFLIAPDKVSGGLELVESVVDIARRDFNLYGGK